MSAYVVSDATIHRIVDLFNQGFGYPQGYLNSLGLELCQLNCAAVNARYAHNPSIPEESRDSYEFQYPQDTSIYQKLKSLQCFIYQCSEGDGPKHPLYEKCKQLEHTMIDEIMDTIPEYQQAKWGER